MSKYATDHAPQGIDFLKTALPGIPKKPGIYKMIGTNLKGKKNQILYIGKAKSLKDRLTSYTILDNLTNRIRRMVLSIEDIEYEITPTEVEALILEASLIRSVLPPYNVLLKDDKSNPYIVIDGKDQFPRFFTERISKKKKQKKDIKLKNTTTLGPFGDKKALDQIITITRKLFKIRNCTNTKFKTQKKPCLDYQLGLCSAPCVNYITPEEYKNQIKAAIEFLSGKNKHIKKQLVQKMNSHSDRMEFEQAAAIRDILRSLNKICHTGFIDFSQFQDIDCFVLHQLDSEIGIEVFKVRNGLSYGGKIFFHEGKTDIALNEILRTFITDYYLEESPYPPQEQIDISFGSCPPQAIYTNIVPEDKISIELALAKLLHTTHIKIITPKQGTRKKIIDFILVNLKEKILLKSTKKSKHEDGSCNLRKMLGLENALNRIEVYDNSHNSGSFCVGAMIVARKCGFDKNEYRKFNIKFQNTTAGDDCGMLKEVLERRFTNKDTCKEMPDLIIIDGGLAQYTSARKVLTSLNLEYVPLLCIAKGPKRNAGEERLFYKTMMGFSIFKSSSIAYYLQNLRDEAHRFAINSYRAKALASNFNKNINKKPNRPLPQL